jgi:hypothetical protein
LELIAFGLVLLGAAAFFLLPGREPPEIKRLRSETDRLLAELGQIPGGIQGPHKAKLEKLLEELDGLYQETMRLLAKVQELNKKGNESHRLQNHVGTLQRLAARQREILLPYWRLQTQEKTAPGKKRP